MRKLIVLIFCILSMQGAAQQYSDYDTIRRNEISVSFLPIFVALAGYEGNSSVGSYNLSYRRFIKKRFVFRTDFVFGHRFAQYNNFEKFDTTIADKNYFTSDAYQVGQKLQLNVGFEKIFRIKRIIHSLGGEVFVSSRKYNYQSNYFWYPVGVNIDQVRSHYINTPNGVSVIGAVYNGIDSLSYAYEQNQTEFGLQLLYTARFRISKRFYLSTSMGPSLSVDSYTTRHVYGNKDLYKRRSGSNFNMNLWITDLSLTFRF